MDQAHQGHFEIDPWVRSVPHPDLGPAEILHGPHQGAQPHPAGLGGQHVALGPGHGDQFGGHEGEAALADQFGRPVPLVLVVDGVSAPPPAAETAGPTDGPTGGPGIPATDAAVPADDGDLADFDADNLEVVEIDNSAEARLLQAFPGAEEVV